MNFKMKKEKLRIHTVEVHEEVTKTIYRAISLDKIFFSDSQSSENPIYPSQKNVSAHIIMRI